MSDNAITIQDSYILDYPQATVWAKLNDPDILALCIKGCSHVERESDQKFKAVIRAKIGEVKKDFCIDLDVDDANAPDHYLLSTVVSVGFFGQAKGQADVHLKALEAEKTALNYTAIIDAKGLLVKMLPLIKGVARRRVNAFFDAFAEQIKQA